MHARQHDFSVVLGERPGFLDQLGDPARAVRPARQRRRAEGAMLVAAVLDLEEAAVPAQVM